MRPSLRSNRAECPVAGSATERPYGTCHRRLHRWVATGCDSEVQNADADKTDARGELHAERLDDPAQQDTAFAYVDAYGSNARRSRRLVEYQRKFRPQNGAGTHRLRTGSNRGLRHGGVL